MIVPISRPFPAAHATNHPNQCYRFLRELPTCGRYAAKEQTPCRGCGDAVWKRGAATTSRGDVGDVRAIRRESRWPLSLDHRLPGKFAAGRESQTHTIPAGFARNTKPQPCRLLVEGAHDYSGGSKMPEYLLCALRANQAKQGRATDNFDAGLRQ